MHSGSLWHKIFKSAELTSEWLLQVGQIKERAK